MVLMQTFIEKNNIRIASCALVSHNPNNPDWRDANHFKLVLERKGGQQITIYFSQDYGCSGEPDVANVLNYFASESEGFENNPAFDDWCFQYGYDQYHNRSFAKRVYNSYVAQANKVKRWLGEELYEQLTYEVDGI